MGSTDRGRRLRWWTIFTALTMVVAACTGGTTDTTGAEATVPGATTTPGDTTPPDTGAPDTTTGTTGTTGGGEVVNPGLYVHAADDEPLSLDPAQVAAGEAGETIIIQVYERLVEIGPGGPDLIPGLSTEVPTVENGLISEDGLTYTFPIREGVVFHDGSELTADVVKYSWDRALTMDLPEGNSSVLSDLVASTEVDGNNFVVTLNERNAAFLNSVVTAAVASIVSQEAVEANGGVEAGVVNEFMASNAVGSGPYALTAWNRGENIQLEVFADYWGDPAALDVRIDQVADSDVRALGLQAGDYDSIETDPTFIGDLEGAEGVEIFSGDFLLEPVHMGMNMNIPEGALPPEDTIPVDFFHDVNVRRGFNLAFDYQAFVDGAMAGLGGPIPHYLPQGMLGYDESLPTFTQDLAAAQEAFTAAGYWDEGFTMTVLAEEGGIFEIAGLVLADSMAALNPAFRINVLAVVETQFDSAHAENPFQYAAWIKNADPFADPAALFSAYIHPDGEWGAVHNFRNAYADADQVASLVDEAAVELDQDRRVEIYQELAQILYDDPVWLIPGNERALMAHRSWVQNFQMNPLWPRPSIKFQYFDK
ncbi:MAG TPA: ABC transporter substrate-binding protein [Acidimicrobiia bacterium]|nr:ABC transporter substrate-binding protein [Acidimicrobiia bacterium]